MHATSVFSSTPLASGSSCWGGLHGLGIPNAQTNTVSATNMCWFEDKVQVEKLTQLVWLKCLYMMVICQMGKLQNELQSSTRTRTYPNPKCIGFFWEAILKNQQKPVKIILSFQVTHVTPQRNYAKFSQCKTSHPRYQISFLLSEHNTLGRAWPVSGLIMLRSTDS